MLMRTFCISRGRSVDLKDTTSQVPNKDPWLLDQNQLYTDTALIYIYIYTVYIYICRVYIYIYIHAYSKKDRLKKNITGSQQKYFNKKLGGGISEPAGDQINMI